MISALRIAMSTLLVLIGLAVPVVVSLSSPATALQLRRCDLCSHDGKFVIGSIVERRIPTSGDRDGIHEVWVASSIQEIRQEYSHTAAPGAAAATDDNANPETTSGNKPPNNSNNHNKVLKVTMPFVDQAGSVGSSLWPSSLVGTILMHSRHSQLPKLLQNAGAGSEEDDGHKNTRVLELGSGLGLGGMVAAQHVDQVVLTDNDLELVELLQQHIEQKQDTLQNKNIRAQQLDWRDAADIQEDSDDNKFDVILGFDVAYYYYLMGPLVTTIRKLQKKKNLVLLIGQANREIQWQLYHHIRDGGYNQLTDEHEAPWEGRTQTLLYKLKMGKWRSGEEADAVLYDDHPTSTIDDDTEKDKDLDGTIPVAALLHTTYEVWPMEDALTPHEHVATEQDEQAQMMSF